MIRWSYVVPRLIALIVFVTAVQICAPIALRWSVIHALQVTTRTSVDVDRAWVSLARGKVRIDGVRIARSDARDTNLVEFKSATLAIDLGALARRQYIIDSARIRGIQLDTARHPQRSSGDRFQLFSPAVGEFARKGRELSGQWLSRAVRSLELRVEEEFESIRMARRLADRWPIEYGRLELQVRKCRESAEQLRDALSEPPEISNSPQKLAELQELWEKVKSLRQEATRLRGLIERTAGQLAEDRAAIETAFMNDREKLRQRMRLAQLNSQLLNDYLLNGEIQRWWGQMQPWLVLASRLTESPATNDLGSRGTWVQFGSESTRPGFLIRSASLDGQLSVAGHAVGFVGRGWDICTDPELNERPLRLQLLTRGPFTARLSMEFDKSDGIPRSHFAFQCADLPLDQRTWGDDVLSASVAAGTAGIDARLDALGRKVVGRIVLVQKDITLTMATRAGAEPGDTASAARDTARDTLLRHLHEAASSIKNVEIALEVDGTIDHPQWSIRSNLGPALRARLQQVFQQAIDAHAEKLAAEAGHRLNQGLTRLQEQMDDRQKELQRQLDSGERLLSSFSAPVASRIRPIGQLLRKF